MKHLDMMEVLKLLGKHLEIKIAYLEYYPI